MQALRIDDVVSKTRLSKTTIYAEIKASRFPAPRRVRGVSLWLDSDVNAYLEKLPTVATDEARQ